MNEENRTQNSIEASCYYYIRMHRQPTSSWWFNLIVWILPVFTTLKRHSTQLTHTTWNAANYQRRSLLNSLVIFFALLISTSLLLVNVKHTHTHQFNVPFRWIHNVLNFISSNNFYQKKIECKNMKPSRFESISIVGVPVLYTHESVIRLH